jgi:CheY-specific phosphatase CheX
MSKATTVSTDEILLMLCRSVTGVLTSATGTDIHYSAMVQKINKTCLKPDIGCFVLFDGGFSGLVVTNFSAPAALEIYQTYLTNMGLPAEELAQQHTADEVGNVLGELMNQIVGDFTGKIGKELLTSINQNQPKMLVINKEVIVSINTNLDRPQARRVTFTTGNNNIFYLELAMDKTEFIKLHDFDQQDANPDRIIDEARSRAAAADAQSTTAGSTAESALLEELGL